MPAAGVSALSLPLSFHSAPTPIPRHVSQSESRSKRYRGVHSDVFVIADEDEELGEQQADRKSVV